MWRNDESTTAIEVTALRALGDESRLRAALALQEGELCVCQIVELLNLAPSTVSKHLHILKDAGIVHSRKKGRWVYYRLSIDDARGVPGTALQMILDSARDTDAATADRQRLRAIIKLDPDELCEIQKKQK